MKKALIVISFILIFSFSFAEVCNPEPMLENCCEASDREIPFNVLIEAYLNNCKNRELDPVEVPQLLETIKSNYDVQIEENDNKEIIIVGLTFKENIQEKVDDYLNSESLKQRVKDIDKELITLDQEYALGEITLDQYNEAKKELEALKENALAKLNAKNTNNEIKNDPFSFTPLINALPFIAILIIIACVGGGLYFLIKKKEKELYSQINELKEKIKGLEKDYLRGKMDEMTYRHIMEEYQMKLNDLKTKLRKMKKSKSEPSKKK